MPHHSLFFIHLAHNAHFFFSLSQLEPSYALKYIELAGDMSADAKQRTVAEVQTLLNLSHPNLVKYHRAFLYDGRLCYMTEFAECGTLHHLVYTVKERNQRLPDALVWHLFTQICQGLKRLHDAGIIHRALKSRNLLLFPEQLYAHPYLKYRCKLTDLGIPELQSRITLGELDGSSLRYLAPEVLTASSSSSSSGGGSGSGGGSSGVGGYASADERADVWSLGCVLYEMVTLSHAFNATSAILRAEWSPLPSHVSTEVREVLEAILVLEPEKRPTIDDLLALPALASCYAELPNPMLLEGGSSSHHMVLPEVIGGSTHHQRHSSTAAAMPHTHPTHHTPPLPPSCSTHTLQVVRVAWYLAPRRAAGRGVYRQRRLLWRALPRRRGRSARY